MHAEAHWQRAIVLFQQQRWDLAVRELRALLSQEPDHAPAHALLARTLAATGDGGEALAEAKRAVALDPELDFAYAALAAVHWFERDHDAAAAAILRAVEIDPDDASHRGMLAQIRIGQRRWEDALVAADEGLALAPEDTDCLNLRAIALAKLGRGDEARDSVDASLARDPDNPYTHQTRALALLHAGDSKGAVHHFQEALRRDPTLDSARAGLVEALKARNPLYRWVLGWFLWLERFSGPRQLAIVLGLWFGARVAGQALRAGGHPTAATVVSFSWLAFVLVTSCAVPIFNLLLLLHPVGRHALERRARNDALVLGVCVVAAIGLGLHSWLADAMWSTHGAFFFLLFLIPVAGIGLFHPGWGRRTVQAFCVVALGCWLWWSMRGEQLLAAAIASAPGASPDALRAQGSPAMLALDEHLDLFPTLVLAVALSTWFILLAPKGRPPRRRAG